MVFATAANFYTPSEISSVLEAVAAPRATIASA
jgi:hypothetical protein